MRLYVRNKFGKKVFLDITAPTRRSLARRIGSRFFYIGNDLFNVAEVRAEKDLNSTIAGAVVGGLIGALGGPTGILIGGAVGGLLGNTSDDDETQRVTRFNRS